MDYAIVVAAEVMYGTGSLAEEPVTVARLRAGAGERVVRIVGGPTRSGGFARLAGYVVPIAGARVRVDLRDEPAHLALPGPRWAPNDPAGTWEAARLPVVFDVALPPSRDLGAEAAFELEVAARTWAHPACSGFRARYGTTKQTGPGDDGTNAVIFHDEAWPDALVPGAVAQTVLHVDAAGRLRDADIHVNGAEYRFSKDGASGTQDLRGVLVHEIGHALGLGHSTDPRATMSLTGSGLRWRSLEQDDVDGVCALYPGTGGPSCDAAPCPDGFVCVAGACQRPGDRADVCSPCDPEVAGTCEASGDRARCVEIEGGRVCGRACATDAQCGPGFACVPTTEAGDLQCVSLFGCRNGANVCATDADCIHPDARCVQGACAAGGREPRAEDAGAAPDGGASTITSRGSGCACGASARGGRSPEAALAVVLGAALVARRRSRPRARRVSFDGRPPP